MIETTRDLALRDARSALTQRGRAAAHLSRFQDCWNDLGPDDRAWFASWLNSLLIEAVVPGVEPTR